MTIYLSVLLCFIFSSLLSTIRTDSCTRESILTDSYGILILGIFLSVLVGGLRWNTGTDWDSYHDFYVKNKTFQDFITVSSFEIGWKVYNFIIRSLSKNYTFFLIIFHSSIAIFTLLAVRNYMKEYDFDLFLFFLLNFASRKGDFFATRQMLAMAIMFYSVSLYIKKDVKKFFFYSIIAITIHSTSFIILFIPYLVRKLRKRTSIFFMIVVSIIITLFCRSLFFTLLRNIARILPIGFLSGKIITYLNIYENMNSGLGLFLLFRIVIFLPFILYSYNCFSSKERILVNAYLLGISLYLICGSIMPILTRIPQNLINFEAIVMCLYIKKIKNKDLRNIFYIFIIAYAIFKFIYGFYSENTNLYLPYYSILNMGER